MGYRVSEVALDLLGEGQIEPGLRADVVQRVIRRRIDEEGVNAGLEEVLLGRLGAGCTVLAQRVDDAGYPCLGVTCVIVCFTLSRLAVTLSAISPAGS